MTASTPTPPGLTSRSSGRETYLTVSDLMAHLKQQHGRLQEVYRSRARVEVGGQPVERVGFVFEYLARREDEVEKFLGRLADSEREEIFGTWLQYADLSAYDRKVEEMVEAPPTEAADAIARILALDRELSQLYGRLEGSVSALAVQRFFAELRDVVEQRLREHAEQLQQVHDI